MSRIQITSPHAPAAIGLYSQAIHVNNTVYLSGQIPINPETKELVGDEIEMQIKQVFYNLQSVCEAAQANLNDIVKLTIYLTDLKYFPLLNEIMGYFFTSPYPARTTIQVAALPKAAKIEIDAIVHLSG